ncbi:MAG: phosphotransferase [Acidimicrobiales bacterium]
MIAEEVVELLSLRDGSRWALDGRCAGGDVGAWLARRPDGRPVVFKWIEGQDDGRLACSLELVGRLRALGYPIPPHDELAVLPGAAAVVQDLVPHAGVSDVVSHRLLDRLLELNELQAGVAAGSNTWAEAMEHSLVEGEIGYCIRGTLATHGRQAAALLARITRIGRELAAALPPGNDAVHYDFHHRNVLQDSDGVVAVIDWEGCRPGDRVFDLVTLGISLAVADSADGVEQRVWDAVSRLGEPDAVAVYVAHMSLRLVDWSIRNHPDEVPLWLRVATERLDDLG